MDEYNIEYDWRCEQLYNPLHPTVSVCWQINEFLRNHGPAFKAARAIVGGIPGGLGHVNILASFIFAGMSGTAIADAAGLGQIEIKAMDDAGYDRDFHVQSRPHPQL